MDLMQIKHIPNALTFSEKLNNTLFQKLETTLRPVVEPRYGYAPAYFLQNHYGWGQIWVARSGEKKPVAPEGKPNPYAAKPINPAKQKKGLEGWFAVTVHQPEPAEGSEQVKNLVHITLIDREGRAAWIKGAGQKEWRKAAMEYHKDQAEALFMAADPTGWPLKRDATKAAELYAAWVKNPDKRNELELANTLLDVLPVVADFTKTLIAGKLKTPDPDFEGPLVNLYLIGRNALDSSARRILGPDAVKRIEALL